MARERSGDRLEHLSMYRHRCSSSREELRKDFATHIPVAQTCWTDLRPPEHLTLRGPSFVSCGGALPTADARQDVTYRRTADRAETLTDSKTSPAT